MKIILLVCLATVTLSITINKGVDTSLTTTNTIDNVARMESESKLDSDFSTSNQGISSFLLYSYVSNSLSEVKYNDSSITNMDFFTVDRNNQVNNVQYDLVNKCTILNDSYYGMISKGLSIKNKSKSFTMFISFVYLQNGVILSELGQNKVNTGWHHAFIETVGDRLFIAIWNVKSNYFKFDTQIALTKGMKYYLAISYDEISNILDVYLNGLMFPDVNKGVKKSAPWENNYNQYYRQSSTTTISSFKSKV